jgi:hypothetical protein
VWCVWEAFGESDVLGEASPSWALRRALLYREAARLDCRRSSLTMIFESVRVVCLLAGSLLTQEARNNSFKLCKWTAQSMLAGADQMKIG